MDRKGAAGGSDASAEGEQGGAWAGRLLLALIGGGGNPSGEEKEKSCGLHVPAVEE